MPSKSNRNRFAVPARSSKLSPTERRNARSRDLDRMPLRAAIRLMLSEEASVPRRLLKEAPQIERAVKLITNAFRNNGRLFYVGAGTSGRLGVLDASECPPTFRSPSRQVQAIIAGGAPALLRAVEGAEDDADDGEVSLRARGLTSRDVVVGIAASGTTPFVWGALQYAMKKGARTIFLCFNPHLVIERGSRPTVVLAPNLGPEVLTGSTRLKAGTATKLVLNLFSTLAMVKTGKVLSNLMVDLSPSNIKLRARAVRIVQQLTGLDDRSAHAALARHGWKIKKAISGLSRK